MENAHSNISNNSVSSSAENMQRKMILLKLEENEKSKFDDELSCTEQELNNYPEWDETEKNVTESENGIVTTKSGMSSEWTTESVLDTETEEQESTECEKNDDSSPRSFYQLMELNKEPSESIPRISRVPSQYQLDALSEMFLYDVPLKYTLVKCEKSDIANNQNLQVMNPLDMDRNVDRNGMTPFFVNSEYVSEMLI